MATKEQKYNTLNIAIKVTKEAARGGIEKYPPHYVLEETYKTIIKITDEIEQSND